jgi:hypothetical protein
MFYSDDDVPQDTEDDNFGGWRSGLRWLTAPLGGGPMDPPPSPPDNPNSD